MIGYLKGEISHVFPEYCFVAVNGVGYRVFIPESTRKKLIIGQTAQLYTYLNVREDAHLLFGFINQDDYELFMQLIGVTGIGPKVGLTILSSVSAGDFRIAVVQKNLSVLTKIPGIGKKTAERLVLELKDKLQIPGLSDETVESGHVEDATGDNAQEALQALLALGYSQSEVIPLIRKLNTGTLSVELIIKSVLKEFARGK
jgi:Holliday junction DNA helicase RuvA